MCPQTRLLPVQPQIRLADRISTHLLANLLVLAVLILDRPVGNRVHNMHALLTQFARERLRQLPHGGAPSSVRSKLRTATQCTKGTSKNQRLLSTDLISVVQRRNLDSDTYAFLLAAVCKRRLPMVSVEPFHALLRKRKRPADIRLQTILELLARLRKKRLLRAVLDAVNCDLRFQAGEALVRLDIFKRLLDRRLRCVRGKRLEDRGGTGLPDRFDDGL